MPRFSIDELCENCATQLFEEADYLNKSRLRKIFQGILSVQTELNIIPNILSLESKESIISVTNPAFMFFLSKIEKEEYVTILENFVDDIPEFTVRKRNKVWRRD